jgi:sigma-B regulation protein RsbU (phosphoserine phosphatase)
MEMVSALSRAREPQQVLREFARGFYQLDGPRGYLSISTRGLQPGEYKITRLLTDDLVQHMGDADPWHNWSSIDVSRGGAIGEIIREAYPQILHDVDLGGDPVLGDRLARYRSIMAIPLFDDGEPLNWAISLREDPQGFSVSELEDAILRSNIAGTTVRNVMIASKLREANERIRREIHEIARIQRALLPREIPEIPGLSIGVSYRTFDTAGGDIYDFVPASRLETLEQQPHDPMAPWNMVIADAAGHGPAAATVVAMLNAILYAYPTDRGEDTPAAVMAFANRHLIRKRLEGTFVTAVLARYDPRSRRFTYARAGHPPPLLMQGDASLRRRLDAVGGLPLGVIEDAEYEEASVEIEPGQTLVLYTDGITEAMNPAGTMFGVDGIERSLVTCSGEPDCVIGHVTGALLEHEEGVRPGDDQTLVAMKAQ